jgi:hypothetical protein
VLATKSFTAKLAVVLLAAYELAGRASEAAMLIARAADELERAVEFMEAEAYRRAVHGVDRPVAVAGQRELVRQHSDRLLIFLLKARKPEIYGERVKHAGRRDVEHRYDVADLELSPELRARVRRVLDGEEDAE